MAKITLKELLARSKVALVLQEIQNGIVGDTATFPALAEAAAAVGVIPHATPCSPWTGLDADGDLILPRYHGLSPMTGSPLDSLLRNAGVGTIVVAGVSLNVALPNLMFDAVNRTYQVVVVTDAVAGTPVEHGADVRQHTLALLATLATTDEVVATWHVSAAP